MYLLDIDARKNRIHITFSASFDEDEAKKLHAEIEERLPELRPGFHVLCDLSTLNDFKTKAKVHFRSVMDLCNKHGVHKVIRIFPNPRENFGVNLMSYFHYCEAVKQVTCHSFEEAQKHL